MTRVAGRVTLFLVALVLVVMGVGYFSARSVDTEIEIHAPSDRVWQSLVDFGRYGEWNPFIVKVDGPALPGSRLAVTISPPIGGRMDFNLTLKHLEPQREMIWTGQTILPGVLDGEHYFRIESVQGDRVIFRQGERYRGVLLYLAWPVLKWSVTRSFTQMNLALGRRAGR